MLAVILYSETNDVNLWLFLITVAVVGVLYGSGLALTATGWVVLLIVFLLGVVALRGKIVIPDELKKEHGRVRELFNQVVIATVVSVFATVSAMSLWTGVRIPTMTGWGQDTEKNIVLQDIADVGRIALQFLGASLAFFFGGPVAAILEIVLFSFLYQFLFNSTLSGNPPVSLFLQNQYIDMLEVILMSAAAIFLTSYAIRKKAFWGKTKNKIVSLLMLLVTTLFVGVFIENSIRFVHNAVIFPLLFCDNKLAPCPIFFDAGQMKYPFVLIPTETNNPLGYFLAMTIPFFSLSWITILVIGSRFVKEAVTVPLSKYLDAKSAVVFVVRFAVMTGLMVVFQFFVLRFLAPVLL